MRTAMLRLSALLTVSALCFLSPAKAVAGPIRDFIRENRPGLIFPKRVTPSCGSCQSAPVAPAPISDPGLDVSPFPNASGVFLRPVSGGGCPGGSCPTAPRSPYTYGPGCPCPVGECPCDRSGASQSAPHQAVTQAGALVATSGRVLLPNGDGTYRYADERPVYLPSYSPALPSGCPGGRCPIR